MKRCLYLLMIVSSVIALHSCGGRKVSKTPIISGHVTGLTSRALYVMPEFERSFVVDTLTINEDKFAFSFVPDTTSFITLYFDQMDRRISLLVHPESAIQLEGSIDSLTVRNDSLNQRWLNYYYSVLPMQDSILAVQSEMRNAYKQDTMELYFEHLYSDKRMNADSLWNRKVNTYVKENTNNPTVLLAINDYISYTQNTDSLVTWMSSLGPLTNGFALQKRLKKIADERRISKQGHIIPYLNFVDAEDKEVKTEGNKGLTFLYFYVQEDNFTKAVKKDLMALKKELEKDHKKIAAKDKNAKLTPLSFWAISYADNSDLWKESIKTDSTKITNLFSKQGLLSDQLAGAGIGTIPSLLVINEKQEIVSYNLYAAELKKTIKAYLAK
ncbi:MAG: DUF4369 domain-containing protein [Bacteroidales bacterium]